MLERGAGLGAFRPLLFRYFCSYSTAASAAVRDSQQKYFLADCLINMLDFSREEATSAESKLRYARLKPTNNPPLVIDFLENAGLEKTQIKTLVSKTPEMLFSDVDKTVKPKVQLLQDLGLAGSDLGKFLLRCRSYLARGLHTCIRPCLSYLTQVLGSDEKAKKAITRTPWLLTCNPKKMASAVSLMQGLGFSDVDIGKIVGKDPLILIQNPKWFEEIAQRVEKFFCTSRGSLMFYHGFYAISGLNESSMERKLGVFRSLGWSCEDAISMFKKRPYVFTLSEAKLHKATVFFMNELGCTPKYLASRPVLFELSLEKRVVPRYQFLRNLNESRLCETKIGLYTAVALSELNFTKKFVRPYKDKLPDACELYIKASGKQQALQD